MFPDLFDAIGTTYGAGDGSTTFNLPNYSDGKFPEGSTVAGVVKQAGLPNITSEFRGAGYSTDGAIYADTRDNGFASGTAVGMYVKYFDASRSSSIYGNSTTVQPYSLTTRFIIKAYDGVTPTPAEADISEMLTELTGKANRDLDNLSADGENHFLENDFTIIYPNGGSEASPANVTDNSRYVESNPFPGYYVNCVAEVLVNAMWENTGWFTWLGSESAARGVTAHQQNDESIIVQTGNDSIYEQGKCSGGTITTWALTGATAPCRVKVWKIGKIPTA
jgi:hypothetical protein